MTKKIDYSQSPGLIHKNDEGEWGMWRQWVQYGTAVYWQKCSYKETRMIEGFKKNRKKRLQEYINCSLKAYKESLPYNPCLEIK